ncbi:helix-loop-helix DNA-binding domain-containing protein [Colletotrichum abscissum]|uniref:Helix-loop-helix DNA-binding domain-containing protein n=1 Tax=Colletotrichum abscissum TaxID=1671311 RepID=A0A9P9XDK2_9PEZI|nr:helix-loop-helix DNA-binding domain-containing protein [Colletotrichum abscissum]
MGLRNERSSHDSRTMQDSLHYFVCRCSPPVLEDRRKKSDDYFYQQMIASTPLSPHFSPEVFGGAFDVGDRQHHATRPGNQTTQLSPGHNRPNAINESTTATPLNQVQAIAGIPGLPIPVSVSTAQFPQIHNLGGLQHLNQQHQQNHPQLHPSALGLGLELGTLGLTHAEGNQGLQHQFGPAAAPAPNIAADQQGTSSHLHLQGHQRAPAHAAAWLPPGYGVPVYHDNPQQHVDATSSSATAAGVNPPVTLSAAAGLSTDGRNQNVGVGGGHLYDFGFAAPPLLPTSEQSFLGGGVYADITPLSTTVAVTAHPQPPTTTFDFHASPWRPRLQDSSSVTLTPNIAAVAAAELNHDVRKHSKSSMETDSDVKDPSWDDDDNEPQDRRGGAGAMKTSSSSSPGTRKPQRKGKRRAVADPEAGGNYDNDEPTSPAGRTSVSGRSVKSVSVASSAGSSTKTAPAPRLRSASRTSKNALQKPTESLEERRTRASHNLVEKQYRNRLNAQFEGLLNALPEQVRGPAGAGDGDESDPQAAAAAANEERRVSKAEVLDMARRHIQNLERERETLHRERGELLRNLETLEREAAVNGGGGGRLDEFLDVEGVPDERGESSSSWRNA